MLQPKNHTLRVAQEIIDYSEPGDAYKCMVANAIRKQIPGSFSVDVTGEYAKFNLADDQGDVTRFIYQMPARAALELAKFDAEAEASLPSTVKPFSFKLDNRQCYIQQVQKHAKQPGKKMTPNKGTKKACRQWAKARRRHGLKVILGGNPDS